jgi:hypothetical protein
VRRSIELSDVGMPAPDYPEECPAIPAAEFEARMAALLAAADADWVVVYGDREHHPNLVWLCNLDPRFEEALLVLGRDRRTLLLGRENVGYTSVIPAGLDFDVVCVPTFSLMGMDRSGFPTVEQALRDAGISAGDRVAVVGWKALLPAEWNGGYEAIFAPAFFVDTLRAITGDPALVTDATAVVTNPRDGLRTFCSADQIAVFEWGAARCSAWISMILRSVRPGMTEREAFHVVPWAGEPLSMHPVFSSGPEVAVGLRSPSTRRLELGDAGIVAIGLWGGNCARGGILASDAGDLRPESDGWLEGMAIPYWRVMATWHESLGLGVRGGDVFETVTEMLAGERFQSSFNPGHLVHYEEWLDSPIRAGSDDPIASGMVLQTDIIPTGIRPGWTANCEDTVAIADESLRAELAERHPELWARVQARQAFVRDRLGIALRDEVLPLSCTPAYFAPFWLSPERALAFA